MEFTVMSYNILSQVLLESHADLYSSCSNYHLIWKNRSAALLNEILSFESDIVCLQEVEELHWFETFQPILEHFGYQSVFKRRTLQNTDGCAILFKSSKFSLIKSKPVEFCKGGILDRGNIGIVVLLRPKTSVYQGDVEKICIATTHLLFNPKRGDVKLAQLILFLAEIDRYAFCPKTVARQSNLNQSNSTSSNVSKSTGQEEPHPYCPTILCGDFNTEPFSKIYKFITKGQMNYERVLCRIASGQREGFASGGTSLIPRDLIPDWLNITEKCQYFQRPRGSHAEEIDHTRTIANALNYVRGTNSCCVAPGNFQFLGCYQLDQNASPILINPYPSSALHNTSQTHVSPNQPHAHQNTSQTFVNPNQQNAYQNTSQTFVNPNQQNTYPNTSQTLVNPNQQNTYQNTSQTLINPNQQNTYQNTSQTLVNPYQQNTYPNTSQTLVNPNQQNTYPNTSQTLVNPNQQNTHQNTSQTFVNPNQQNTYQNTSQTFVNPNQQNARQNTSQTLVNPNQPNERQNTSQTFVNPNQPNERQNTSQTFVNPNLPDANENISQTFVNPNLPSGGSSLPSDNGGHSVNSKTNDSVNQVENTMEEQNRYNTGMIYHQFQFKSVYQHDFVINRKKHVEVTTYHKRASCTLDYIFYSSSKFRVPPDGRMLSKHVKDKKSHQDNSDHNQGSPAKRAKDVESESGEGQLMGGKRGQMSQGHTKSGKAKHKGKRKKGKNEESKQTVVIIDDDKVSTGEISQGHNVPSTSRERDVLTAESTNRNENSGNVPNYQDSSKAQTNDNKRSTAANQEGVVLYENHLQLLSRCSLLTEAEIKKIGYMPNMNCPSDHLCLVSKFILH